MTAGTFAGCPQEPKHLASRKGRLGWRIAVALVAVLLIVLVAEALRRGIAEHHHRAGQSSRAEFRLSEAAQHLHWARLLRPERAEIALDLAWVELERGDLRRARQILLEVGAEASNDVGSSPFAPRPMAPGYGELRRLIALRLAALEGQGELALELARSLVVELNTEPLLCQQGPPFEEGRASSEACKILRLGQVQIWEASVLHGLHGERAKAELALSAVLKRAGDIEGQHGEIADRLRGDAHLEMARLEYSFRRNREELFERHLEPALAAFKRAGDLRGHAETLSFMGVTALAGGDYARHEELQSAALGLFQEIGNLDGPARIELFFGAMDIGLERLDDAHRRYRSARQQLESLGQVAQLRILDRLEADLELRLGHYEAGRRRLEDLLPRIQSPSLRRKALFSLGHARFHAGEPRDAAERYAEALAEDLTYDFDDPAFRARLFFMLGLATTEAGEPEMARRTLEKARSLALEANDAPGLVMAWLATADLTAARASGAQDEEPLSQALDAIEAALDVQAAQADAAESPFTFEQYRQSIERLRFLLLDIGVQAQLRSKAQNLLLRLLEEMRHRAFRASTFRAAARRQPTAKEAAAIAELEFQLDRAYPAGAVSNDRAHTATVVRNASAGPGERDLALEKSYRRYRRAVVETELAMSTQAPKRRPLDSAWIRSQLAADEAIVIYAFGRQRLFAFWIHHQGAELVDLSVGFEELGDRLHLLIGRLEESFEGSTEWRSPARGLYDDLIAPLGARLDETRRLAIVPLGPLHDVPWAALLTPADRPLIEERVLISAPSLRALLAAPPPARGNGATGFCVSQGVEGPTLPLAAEECRKFARWTGGQTHVDGAANEKAMRAASSSRLLHLAAHGRTEPKMPLLSRLILARGDFTAGAGNGGGLGDGRWTLREILGLELKQDLVVLSSCRATASFSKRKADWTDADRLGLSAAFLHAGARQVVSSLLPISDRGAQALMTELYRELRLHPPAEALARAQSTRYAAGDVAVLGFGVHGALRSEPLLSH